MSGDCMPQTTSNQDYQVIASWLAEINTRLDALDSKLNHVIYIVIGFVILIIAMNPEAIKYLIQIVSTL